MEFAMDTTPYWIAHKEHTMSCSMALYAVAMSQQNKVKVRDETLREINSIQMEMEEVREEIAKEFESQKWDV